MLVEDLIDSVCICTDQLTLQVTGAPLIFVPLEEAGLTQGCAPVVSKAGLEPARPNGHQPLKLARLPFRHFDVGSQSSRHRQQWSS